MFTSKRKNEDKPKGPPRHTLLIAITAALALVLIAAGVFLSRSRFIPMSDVPRDDLVYTEGDKLYTVDFQTGERIPGTPMRRTIDLKEPSPDGKWEIRFESLDKYMTTSLVLEDLTGQQPLRTLGTFYGADNTLSWSPNQQWVAFTVYDTEVNTSQGHHPHEIWMVHIPTGELKRLSSNTYLDSNPSFSPDGTQLVYMSAADGLPRVYIMSVATGESRLLTPEQYGDNPSWSPDGQWVAFEAWYRVSGSYLNNIYIVRIDGTHIQPITLGKTESNYLIGWRPES